MLLASNTSIIICLNDVRLIIIDSDRVTNIKNRRIAERNARRTRRQAHRKSVACVEATHNDGMSSDDELTPNDASKFAAEKSKYNLQNILLI